MKSYKLFSLFLFSLSITQTVSAAVLIQSQDAQKQITNIYIEHYRARISMPKNEGFIVMDMKKKSMKAVMHEQKMVMDMSEFIQDTNSKTKADSRVKSQIKKIGSGPKIAGYKTQGYVIYGNNKNCGTFYVSANAMSDLGIEKFAVALSNLDKNMQEKMSTITGMPTAHVLSTCDEAERQVSIKFKQIGFPLKTLNKNKQLESIVIKLDKNARLPKNAFTIPANYKVTSPAKMMNEAMQKMKKMQPKMQEMMKNMAPEIREMMKQQMKQY